MLIHFSFSHLSYWKEMYTFLENRCLFKPFSGETCCQPLRKFGMFTCLCFWTMCFNMQWSIFSVKKREGADFWIFGDKSGEQQRWSTPMGQKFDNLSPSGKIPLIDSPTKFLLLPTKGNCLSLPFYVISQLKTSFLVVFIAHILYFCTLYVHRLC